MAALSPLLDVSFLTALARQLRAARDRLTLRTAGNLPGVAELVVALRLYVARCDRQRAEDRQNEREGLGQGEESGTAIGSRNPPELERLAYYLALADFAYFQSEDNFQERLEIIGVDLPLVKVAMAGKWAPGYFVVRDRRYDAIVVVVRGSKEISDLVTNLSAEPEPFLGGFGHQGMVKSAHHLYYQLRQVLSKYLTRFRPSGGLVIVGHSLGGAVAAALTMLFKSGRLDRDFEEGDEEADVKGMFRRAKCFAFCPPPCLSKELAEQSRSMGIVSVVAGFDVVPRLSAASLDRFLVKISRYNWGRDVGDSFGQAVGNVARGFLPEENAQVVTRAVTEHGVTGLTLASTTIAHTAQAALNNRGSTGRSALWSLALNATVFVGSMVSDSLAGNHRRTMEDERRGQDYSFARHFGMSEGDVERVLGEGVPKEVFLAGVVYHLDRPYSVPDEGGIHGLPRSRLFERNCEYFQNIEACAYMVHDHHPEVVLQALENIEM